MTNSSPAHIDPDDNVPVTTVPAPLTENTRSTNKRAGNSLNVCSLASTSRTVCASVSTRASMPSPVTAEVHSGRDHEIGDEASSSSTSLSTSTLRSALTRSTRVSATTPANGRIESMTARCSRVCARHPSTASMTSNAIEACDMPAIIVFR